MRFFYWVKKRLAHKLEHMRWSNVKSTLREHGLALVIIIVGWEIIEDIIFPMLFVFLGNNVHPAFYAGAPAAWIICLHWLAVPILWGWWMRLSGKEKENVVQTCKEQHPHD